MDLSALLAAHKRNPNDMGLKRNLAVHLFSSGSYFRALSIAKDLIAADPNCVGTHVMLYDIYYELSDELRSTYHFKKAIALGGNSKPIKLMRVRSAARQGKTNETTERILELLREYPSAALMVDYLRQNPTSPPEYIVDGVKKAVADLSQKPDLRFLAAFALAHHAQAKHDYKAAEVFASLGNRIGATTRRSMRFSPAKFKELWAKSGISEKYYRSLSLDEGLETSRDIYILGSSRSGKSLLAHYLSSISDFKNFDEDLISSNYIKNQVGLKPELINKFFNSTIDTKNEHIHNLDKELLKLGPKIKLHTLPEMLIHAPFLGILKRRSTLLILDRNIIDTAISIYFRAYRHGNKELFSVQGIVEYLIGMKGLGEFVQDLLPNNVFRMPYEGLISGSIEIKEVFQALDQRLGVRIPQHSAKELPPSMVKLEKSPGVSNLRPNEKLVDSFIGLSELYPQLAEKFSYELSKKGF